MHASLPPLYAQHTKILLPILTLYEIDPSGIQVYFRDGSWMMECRENFLEIMSAASETIRSSQEEDGDDKSETGSLSPKLFVTRDQIQTKMSVSGKENQSNKRNNEQTTQSSERAQQDDKLCFECNRPLAKSRELINIAGQSNRSWHPECFKCNVCSNLLDQESSCHFLGGKIICKQDYQKLQHDNSTKCSRCCWPISASDWVRRANSYIYHLACFSCDICLRQLSTGEQFTITITPSSNDENENIEESQNKLNSTSNVQLLCRLHFAIEPPAQASKNQSRSETHSSTSNELVRSHSDSSCFEYNDYVGRSKSSGFNHNQNHQQYLNLLQHQNQHHQQQKPNSPFGNQFLPITDGKNATHSQPEPIQGTDCSQSHYSDSDDMIGLNVGPSHLLANVDGHIGQPASPSDLDLALHGQLGEPGTSTSTASSTNGSTSGNLMSLGTSKSKRVRTTFTEDQLSILQTHFQIDSNPDGQDLERIATITGLSKRVTQVWFQNSRARQKKYMIKRKPTAGSSTSTNLNPNV